MGHSRPNYNLRLEFVPKIHSPSSDLLTHYNAHIIQVLINVKLSPPSINKGHLNSKTPEPLFLQKFHFFETIKAAIHWHQAVKLYQHA